MASKALLDERKRLADNKELLFKAKVEAKRKSLTQRSTGSIDIRKFKKNAYIATSVILVVAITTIIVTKK